MICLTFPVPHGSVLNERIFFVLYLCYIIVPKWYWRTNREYYKSEKVEFDNIEVRKILIHTLILPSVKFECGRTYFHSVNLGWFCNSLINTSAVIGVWICLYPCTLSNLCQHLKSSPVCSDHVIVKLSSDQTGSSQNGGFAFSMNTLVKRLKIECFVCNTPNNIKKK